MLSQPSMVLASRRRSNLRARTPTARRTRRSPRRSDGKRLSFNATPSALGAAHGLDACSTSAPADDARCSRRCARGTSSGACTSHSGSRVILSVNPYSWETACRCTPPSSSAARRTARVQAPGTAAAAAAPVRGGRARRRRRAGDDGIRAEAQTQALLVSGESGAGKTEAVKILLAYVCQHDHARCASCRSSSSRSTRCSRRSATRAPRSTPGGDLEPLRQARRRGSSTTATAAAPRAAAPSRRTSPRRFASSATPPTSDRSTSSTRWRRGLPRAELARLRLAEPDAAEVAEHRYLFAGGDAGSSAPSSRPRSRRRAAAAGAASDSRRRRRSRRPGRAYAATSAAGAAGEGSGRGSPRARRCT